MPLEKNVSQTTFLSFHRKEWPNLLYSAPQGLLPFLQEGEVSETRLTLLLQVVYQSAWCNTLGLTGTLLEATILLSSWKHQLDQTVFLIGHWDVLGSEQWIWSNYFNSISCLNFTTSITEVRKTGYSRRTGIMNQSSIASPDLLEALVGLIQHKVENGSASTHFLVIRVQYYE